MNKRFLGFMIAIFIMFLPAVVNADFFESSGRNAWGISGDGNVAVGNTNTSEAFLWNEVDGLVNLGFLPGFDSSSRAYAASADGGVVVGYSSRTGGQQAFRWTEAGGMVDLGNLGGTYTRGRGVSADGTVVVGESYNDAGNTVIEAFRWTASGGIVGLGDLPGGDVASGAVAVSADGSVVVGGSKSANSNLWEAFRWTAADGIVGLGLLPGASESFARGISADGSVIVGSSGGKAFRWTAADGMVALDFDSAFDASSDGSVIVGHVRGFSPGGNVSDLAVRWTAAGGAQTIRAWLEGAGITTDWRVLSFAGGVSDDGCSVAGYGANASAALEAYLARVDAVGGCNTGVAAPDITVTDSVAPNADLIVAFGDVNEMTSADETVTVTNDGNADLILGNIAQANPLAAPFSILNDNCTAQTLTPAANCSLTVRFSPPSTGAFSNSFDIPSNDPDENPVTVDVNGTGIGLPLPDVYSVGGIVSGLTGTGLTLQNNGIDSLSVTANGAFTFTTELTEGSAYAVTVSSQPTGQNCTVSNGSGTIATANVTNVAVTCVDVVVPTYSVGGNVSGLTGTGLVLQNNGADTLAVAADGTFVFVTELEVGVAYAVTVSTQPTGQTCSVTNGTGTIADAAVIDIDVNCVDVAPPAPTPVIPIPTMTEWALVLLSMLLGLMVFANRKRLF